MSILLVDDSRAMRMIVLRELRKAGYDPKDVVEADNGLAALDCVHAGGIDLVLSDWNMPDMNGIRLLHALREEGNKVPFGFVTSESNALVHKEALDAGADFVVVKPFTAESLSEQVETALQGRRQGDGIGAALAPKGATFGSVLEDLLGRQVVTRESELPRTAMAGAVARYRTDGEERMLLVAEIGIAASIGAALSRLPAGAAEDFASEGWLPDNVKENLHEVLNVMSQVVPGYGERWALEDVEALGSLGDDADIVLANPLGWADPVEVTVQGYPSGRVAWLKTA